MKTLMLNLASRPTPFAYQVPDQTYDYFAHYQNIEIVAEHILLCMIEAHANQVKKDLFASIEKWKTKCKEELAIHDRLGK